MEALEAILTRRSVREYRDGEPLPDGALETLLKAAMSAPSAGNQQAWQFIVIDDRALAERIAAIHPNAGMVAQAAVGILVCGDVSREKYPGYWVQDCSAAIENLLLAAHALGLGAVWTGIYPVNQTVEAFRALFGLPGHIVPLALVPVGVPAQSGAPADRYDAERVHHNGW